MPMSGPQPPAGKWPKILPPLTAEQQQRSDEFMKLWHVELAGRSRYGLNERFNHRFSVLHSTPGFVTTLDIGAGLGEHLNHEKLTPEQERNYYCYEFRANMAAEIRRRFPRINTVVSDCQQRMNFPDGFFDRILAVHVLEHLPNLPATLREAHRLLNKERGQFLVVIPTEGGLAYSIARRLSAERTWNKRFGGGYEEFYKREHINLPHEIFTELSPYFTTVSRSFFPLMLPFIFCNIGIGLVLRPRPSSLAGNG
jgi:SAM-dependent methyltransferase